MKTMNEIQRDIKIIRRFKSLGHYTITITHNLNKIGTYLERDMQQIQDLEETDYFCEFGFEEHLANNETYQEVYKTCCERLLASENCDKSELERIIAYYF